MCYTKLNLIKTTPLNTIQVIKKFHWGLQYIHNGKCVYGWVELT